MKTIEDLKACNVKILFKLFDSVEAAEDHQCERIDAVRKAHKTPLARVELIQHDDQNNVEEYYHDDEARSIYLLMLSLADAIGRAHDATGPGERDAKHYDALRARIDTWCE